MCCLSSDKINLNLKQVRPVWKTRENIYMDNTIYYDVKSYQFKTTIVNCTYVQLKGLKILISDTRDVLIASMYGT